MRGSHLRDKEDKIVTATHHTILLLEDEPRVACALARMITHLGHAVIQVGSVESAEQAFLEHEEIGLVVADYGMNSAQTGLDFLRWTKRQRPHVRRVLISGLPLDNQRAHVDETCHHFMRKPFNLKDLSHTISDHEAPLIRVCASAAQ